MEQHLVEKESHKCKDGNSEKNVKNGSSSIVAIKHCFHNSAFPKQ
jgi:hypothetical protein